MELGALSDFQADRVRQRVTGAGQDFTYRSFPGMPHAMHRHQPELYADGDRMGRDAAGQRRLIQAHPYRAGLPGVSAPSGSQAPGRRGPDSRRTLGCS
jgi:hypothetical protein